MSNEIGSPEKVRAMLSENLERVRKTTDDYFQQMEKGLASTPIAGQAKQFTDLMQRNVAATFELCDKLIQAKDPQDAMRIQTEFFQAQMRAIADQARTIGESTMKAMAGVLGSKS